MLPVKPVPLCGVCPRRIVTEPRLAEVVINAPRLPGLDPFGEFRFCVISTKPPLAPTILFVSVSPAILAPVESRMLLPLRSSCPEIKLMEDPTFIFLFSKSFALLAFAISTVLKDSIVKPLTLVFCVPVNLKLPVPALIVPLFTRFISCSTADALPVVIHFASLPIFN